MSQQKRTTFENALSVDAEMVNVFCFSFGTHCPSEYSETNLGSSPVSSLGIVSDFVVSFVPDPVGQGSVALDLCTHGSFSPERFD